MVAVTVRALPSSREIVAQYTIDSVTMDLRIAYPTAYPLRPVELSSTSGGRVAGIPEARWRGWLLTTTRLLTVSASGRTAREALVRFAQNIHGTFRVMEECPICYAIISLIDKSLPTRPCGTCHQKFHPCCLQRWFTSEGGSQTCPLCRAEWVGKAY
ncbi:hypothetical protein CXG81DRAFT_13835 [Caulochytrium protostelioides]|uniref:E3 ubiquitin-protein ligase listerin n=1 Tax=Caulochytrium protostelioides TaxID=1555241 RepID=A0A4P9X4E5_9FUNG|nr:hypothetical protein CXG81DRAFT_13835 [Caulochytrium protostelioides]|eukprot:RKO99939.1 hypothetical protein CXG81DRAFT_13835 [Caulochytrium protostelioides]